MQTLLLVGLGNPGSKYESMRHNIGNRVVRAWIKDARAMATSVRAWRDDPDMLGEVAQVHLPETRVVCLFPHTFMNDSGQAVSAALRSLHLSTESVVVVHDELELPFGEVNIQDEGSAHGHNGVRSIHDAIGTQKIARVRIGIGRSETTEVKNYVLQPFSAEEEERLTTTIVPAAVEAVSNVIGRSLAIH